VLTSCTIVNGVRISIERFSDSTCQSQVSHDLINDNGCLVANGGGTSSSYKLNTNNEQGTDWETCSGTGTLVLQTWQSSDSWYVIPFILYFHCCRVCVWVWMYIWTDRC